MNKVALITGIAGQDGSYLSEHLLDLGYEVHGIVRRQSTAENQESRLEHLNGKINAQYGDLLDVSSLTRIILDTKPTHIFNLGAMSHVRVSFDIPQFTIETNGICWDIFELAELGIFISGDDTTLTFAGGSN